MLLSISRRTDIPAYYSDWLINRLKEKYVCVRNPMNTHQISRINLAPDVVDCIIFWSKNPKPLLEKLQFLNEYAYYFQFTLDPYDTDIEANLPPKNELIETFKKLSDTIGPQRVIWRYDPVLLNNRYAVSYHIDQFGDFAGNLKGYTEKVTFSFIDFYNKIAQNIKLNGINTITTEEKNIIAENFSKIAHENNLSIDTCAEDIDLSMYNIDHARCIDARLIEKITGYTIAAEKDKNQRLECGCAASIDIGEYDSCPHGCIYCYANNNKSIVANKNNNHITTSPLLIGDINADDTVKEREVSSNKLAQKALF